MTRRQILLAVALTIAALFAVFGEKTSSDGIAEPLVHAPISNSLERNKLLPLSAQAAKPGHVEPDAATTRKADSDIVQLALPKRKEYTGGGVRSMRGAELFASQSWLPLPPLAIPLPVPPPVPPPLPFTYIGKKMDGTVWEVYLARGEQTFVVREQTIIEGSYRVEAIKPPSLALAYLPLNKVQTIPIGGDE